MDTTERINNVEKQQDELRERWLDFLETTHNSRTEFERQVLRAVEQATNLNSSLTQTVNGLSKAIGKLEGQIKLQDKVIQQTRDDSRDALRILKNGGRQGVIQRLDRQEEELEKHPETCPIGRMFYEHLEEHKAGKMTKPQKVAVVMAAATALPGWIIGIVSFFQWLGHKLAESVT
jgi:polyribonucleotide nucleotidyltransferase